MIKFIALTLFAASTSCMAFTGICLNGSELNLAEYNCWIEMIKVDEEYRAVIDSHAYELTFSKDLMSGKINNQYEGKTLSLDINKHPTKERYPRWSCLQNKFNNEVVCLPSLPIHK